ncbi:MAG TPA: lipase family protein, partial [Nocardioidaceae bacterium]|nr:lipase family protein [Nocardioidaceae bacterium]
PELLTPSGVAMMLASSGDCINDAVARNPLQTIASMEAVPNALDVPRIKRLLNRNSPLYFPGAPRAPIYHYHASADEFAPLPPARKLTDKWCSEGVKVKRQVDVGEHLTGVVVYSLPALAYLADRFAGKPAPNSCS